MDEMITKANGKRTIPQIFFDDQHIGGVQVPVCDEKCSGCFLCLNIAPQPLNNEAQAKRQDTPRPVTIGDTA